MSSIIFGSVLIITSLFGFTYWWWDVVVILRGLLPIILFIIGVVAIVAGMEILREKQ